MQDFEFPKSFLSPNAAEAQLHQVVSILWMQLPENDRTVERLLEEFTLITDRIIENLKADDAKRRLKDAKD